MACVTLSHLSFRILLLDNSGNNVKIDRCQQNSFFVWGRGEWGCAGWLKKFCETIKESILIRFYRIG